MSTLVEPHGLKQADYDRFRDLVRVKSGIEIPDARRPELERAVWQCIGEQGLPDCESLYRVLTGAEGGHMRLEALIAKLTIGETYFFRNRPQFDALEKHILPALIARRQATRTLRLWSAGCASGEEPYSLAILVKRLLPDLANWNILILATDINRDGLERGRRGVYGNWSFRDGAAALQPTYFSLHERQFEIEAPLRRLVHFEYLNLIEDVYPSLTTNTHQMDLILCRNVLIYFAAETTRLVAGRLYGALAEEGWLIVGHAEPSQAYFHQFATRNFPGAVIYQKAPHESRPAPAVKPAWAPSPDVRLMPAATRTLERRVSAPAPPPADTLTALELWTAGKEGEALALLRQLAASKPAQAQAPYLLAKFHANRLQLSEAEEWVEVALQRSPLLAAAHYLRALILQEGGRHWEALEALRGCVYAEPQFVLGHFALANQFSRLGQPQRAHKSLQNVTRLLAGRAHDELIPEGDGLTVGRLRELAAMEQG